MVAELLFFSWCRQTAEVSLDTRQPEKRLFSHSVVFLVDELREQYLGDGFVWYADCEVFVSSVLAYSLSEIEPMCLPDISQI